LFDDIQASVERYINLKNELYKVESFLKESLRNRLGNTKQEEIVEVIINLLHNQKSLEMIQHENKMIELDSKEQLSKT